MRSEATGPPPAEQHKRGPLPGDRRVRVTLYSMLRLLRYLSSFSSDSFSQDLFFSFVIVYMYCYRLLLRLLAIDCNYAIALDYLGSAGGVSSTSVPQPRAIYVVLYLGVHTTASHTLPRCCVLALLRYSKFVRLYAFPWGSFVNAFLVRVSFPGRGEKLPRSVVFQGGGCSHSALLM